MILWTLFRACGLRYQTFRSFQELDDDDSGELDENEAGAASVVYYCCL